MTHASELISAYLDGELTAEERKRLHGHLSDCSRCVVEMEEMQAVRTAVRSLPILEVPEGIVPEAESEVIPLHRNRGVLVGAAAAVVALVIAVAALVTPPPETVSVNDLNSRFGARVSLDPAFGPAKVIAPDVVMVSE